MRTALTISVFTSALILAAAPAALAQKADLKAEALKDWADNKALMVKISNEMPEDKFGFKSTPPQRNYGEQILHVAQANVGLLRALGGKAAAPTINVKATSKAEIIKALEDSYDYGTAVINEQTADAMLEQVKVPPFLGGMSSRTRLVYTVIGHAWDTYGQMVVYLRLNGHVPPASQRP